MEETVIRLPQRRGGEETEPGLSDSVSLLDAHREHGPEKDPSGHRQGLAEETMRFSQRDEHPEALFHTSVLD